MAEMQVPWRDRNSTTGIELEKPLVRFMTAQPMYEGSFRKTFPGKGDYTSTKSITVIGKPERATLEP